MLSNSSQESAPKRQFLRSNVVGTPALIFFVIATVGPMGAVLGAAPLVFMESGPSTWVFYLLGAALFALFSVGYLAMNRHLGSAGGFVVYIAKGFSHRAGTAAAYVALLTYLSLLCSLYGMTGVFASGTLKLLFQIDVTWWVSTLVCIGLVMTMAYNKVEISVGVLGVLLIVEVVVILWLAFAILAHGGEGGAVPLSFEGLSPKMVFGSGFGLALLFALSSFGGFEATVVYSEEAKSPEKTIPRATYGSLIFLGGFYSFAAWAIGNGIGVSKVQAVAANNPTGMIFDVARVYLGDSAVTIMNILVVTSFFAIVAGVTNILSRYVFALARAGILHRGLAITHQRHGGPSVASLVVSLVALAIVSVFIVAGMDPFSTLYTWLIAIGTVAILCVIAVTAAATIPYFYLRNRHSGESVWAKLIAPTISVVGFAAALFLAIKNFALLVGDTSGSALGWIWLIVPLVWIAGYAVASARGEERSNFSTVAEFMKEDEGLKASAVTA